jgi:hypothetical protein
MTGPGEITGVHSDAILSSGRCVPVGPGRKQPGWPVGSAASFMEEHDVSTSVRVPPDLANSAIGQEPRDSATRNGKPRNFRQALDL